MSTTLFDRQHLLRRCSATWINYLEGLTQVVEPDAHFYDPLPGMETAIQPVIDHTLAGVMTSVDGLDLKNSETFY